MSRPKNRRWALAIQTAKSWNDQPLDHLIPGLTDELDERTKRKLNQRIKMAYQILDNESCKACGTPIWLGHSTMPAIGFKVMRTTCQACATKARVARANKSKDDDGETEYVNAAMYDGTELPHRMEAHATYDEVWLNRGEFVETETEGVDE